MPEAFWFRKLKIPKAQLLFDFLFGPSKFRTLLAKISEHVFLYFNDINSHRPFIPPVGFFSGFGGIGSGIGGIGSGLGLGGIGVPEFGVPQFGGPFGGSPFGSPFGGPFGGSSFGPPSPFAGSPLRFFL